MQQFFSDFLDSATDWLRRPFQPGGSAVNWILFVGLLVIALFMWQLILLHLTEE